jgi:hypothetical protein
VELLRRDLALLCVFRNPKKACFSVRDKLFAFNILPRLKLFRSPGLGFTPSYSMTQVDFYQSTSCTRDSYLDGRGL